MLSHCIVVTPIVAMVAEHSTKEQVILHLLDCAELGGIWDEDLCHLSSKHFSSKLSGSVLLRGRPLLPPERSADLETTTCYQDTRSGPSKAQWIYNMSELRSVQFACEQLRIRVEIGTDQSELRGFRTTSRVIGRLEESVNLHHVNESLHKIIRLEQNVGHGRVGESLRECHVKWNQCTDLIVLQD